MKLLFHSCWWLVLALPVTCFSTDVPTGDPPSSKEPTALFQAADEFKALTRDLGMRPGGPPSAQQRRKKMLWHGRIYENFRNDVLDAIPHEVKQNGENKSPLRRNQFGFNVGGPVLIPHLVTNPNNTFFTLSYEGVRERVFRASLHTIPTVLERQGDFSQTVDQAGNPLIVYDPATTSPNPDYNPNLPVSTGNLQYLRSPFPGNVIPASRLNPAVLEAMSLYPLPNTDIGPFSQNNYFVNAPATDSADGIIAKLDHSFNDRHRMTASSNISSGFLGSAKYFPNHRQPNRSRPASLHLAGRDLITFSPPVPRP